MYVIRPKKRYIEVTLVMCQKKEKIDEKEIEEEKKMVVVCVF